MEWLYHTHGFWCRLQLSILSCSSGNDNQSLWCQPVAPAQVCGYCAGCTRYFPFFFSIKCSLNRLENVVGFACAGTSCGLGVVFRSRMRWIQAVLGFALYNSVGVLTALTVTEKPLFIFFKGSCQ